MGDPRFDNQIGFRREDHLLHCNQILSALDDRSSKPRVVIGVPVLSKTKAQLAYQVRKFRIIRHGGDDVRIIGVSGKHQSARTLSTRESASAG